MLFSTHSSKCDIVIFRLSVAARARRPSGGGVLGASRARLAWRVGVGAARAAGVRGHGWLLPHPVSAARASGRFTARARAAGVAGT
eukprot:1329953-Prymnesium_polylepis.1